MENGDIQDGRKTNGTKKGCQGSSRAHAMLQETKTKQSRVKDTSGKSYHDHGRLPRHGYIGDSQSA
jgi:hypothetical protein